MQATRLGSSAAGGGSASAGRRVSAPCQATRQVRRQARRVSAPGELHHTPAALPCVATGGKLAAPRPEHGRGCDRTPRCLPSGARSQRMRDGADSGPTGVCWRAHRTRQQPHPKRRRPPRGTKPQPWEHNWPIRRLRARSGVLAQGHRLYNRRARPTTRGLPCWSPRTRTAAARAWAASTPPAPPRRRRGRPAAARRTEAAMQRSSMRAMVEPS
mmetsp:Transcript_8863/g.26390  ORF Transcript_8863/g.26390 Transcript_8863/m.26390 type:complete len:214 (-) Transcript_8863:45-686(-)